MKYGASIIVVIILFFAISSHATMRTWEYTGIVETEYEHPDYTSAFGIGTTFNAYLTFDPDTLPPGSGSCGWSCFDPLGFSGISVLSAGNHDLDYFNYENGVASYALLIGTFSDSFLELDFKGNTFRIDGVLGSVLEYSYTGSLFPAPEPKPVILLALGILALTLIRKISCHPGLLKTVQAKKDGTC